MSFYECQGCGKRFEDASEMGREFPDIPHLGERVSPGELVPAGECDECEAVVHERLGMFESPNDVVKFIVGSDQVLCLNLRGKLEQIGVVHDGATFEETDTVGCVEVDERSVNDVLGDEWNYDELFSGLSDGTLVVGELNLIRKVASEEAVEGG